ncbi:hypothetical protein EVJ58_g3525 [Rhodofomes roseus]|uniref:F-box domain-containing protein n=1 Tax=Rhodofomes roseus TaxID=34475 RepID=A0A4Y9YMN9_9APHY|nr:hypothetical protein EVJ58_g3525 [Rhodofomes roseus]
MFRPPYYHVPQELCDEVIDYLWDDVPTLQACAVACHGWVWRAQRHIFRSVAINNAARFERFSRLIKTKPRIATYVRVLTIAKARRSKTKLDRAWPELLQTLRGVEDLTLGRWVEVFSMQEVFKQNLPALFQRIRVLRLTNTSVGDVADLVCLLSACSAMHTLHLDNTRMVWPNWDQVDSIPSVDSPQLHTLSLTPTHAVPITDIWAEGLIRATIRRLELELITPDLFLSCRPVLRAMENTLEELVISVTGTKLRRRPLSGTLPPMKRLRRIHLRVKMLDAKQPIPRQYEWMLGFLRLLRIWESNSHLSEVVLSWRTSDLASMKTSPPWDEFDFGMAKLAKANDKLRFTLNVLDDTGIQNQWIYMVGLGLHAFPSLRKLRTTLAVNMGSSWDEHETFGGSLRNPKQWAFHFDPQTVSVPKV